MRCHQGAEQTASDDRRRRSRRPSRVEARRAIPSDRAEYRRPCSGAPASDYFIGGAVAYANTAKTNLLGVSEDTLRGHGAVSAEVAAEMAEGARRAFNCDVAVSVTGIAGPTGGTSDKPVGLCYWAVAHPSGTKVEHRVFNGNRNQIQQQAAFAALDLLRRAFNGSPR